jgi:hypothetical protein
MSSTAKDADMPQKVRAARLLWHLGYVCPIEVAVTANEVAYGQLKRSDLTDIDVLGIKFEKDLSWHTVIADCKSGKESASSRLFWMRGVMEFFGAERGYLVMPRIGSESREMALRLAISLLDTDNLAKYEKDKQLDRVRWFNDVTYTAYKRSWGYRLAKGKEATSEEKMLMKFYAFFSYRYWYHAEYLNVLQTITAFRDVAGVLDQLPDQQKTKVAAYNGLTLLAISLLKMCGSVIATKSGEIHNEVRRYIFGGAANAIERSNVMKALGKVAGEKFKLEPEYYDDLLELANRLIVFSDHASEMARYSQLILNLNVLSSQSENLSEALGVSFQVDTLKLLKDTAEFLCKATGFRVGVFSELMNQ